MSMIKPLTPLRDVLYAFSLAKAAPDAELLEEFVRRHPEHAAALTDFAIDILVDAVRGDDDVAATAGELKVSPAVSRAMSRFQNRLFAVDRAEAAAATHAQTQSSAVENPFAALDPTAFRTLAQGLHANRFFVTRLRDREIDLGSMTEGFKRRVADELRAPIDLVIAHFAAPAEVQRGQFFKAEEKPEARTKKRFEEALRTSGLTEEQQRYLMSL